MDGSNPSVQQEDFEVDIVIASSFFQIIRPKATDLAQTQRDLYFELLKLPGIAHQTFSIKHGRFDSTIIRPVFKNILIYLHDVQATLIPGYSISNIDSLMNSDDLAFHMELNAGLRKTVDVVLELTDQVRSLMLLDSQREDFKVVFQKMLARLYYYVSTLSRLHNMEIVDLMIEVIDSHREAYGKEFAELVEFHKARMERANKMRNPR